MDLKYTLAYQGQDPGLIPALETEAKQLAASVKIKSSTRSKPTALKSGLAKALAKAETPEKVFVVRDLSLTGENKTEAFERDRQLVDSENGRQIALVYLNKSSRTLNAEAKDGKISEARFINPGSVDDVVVLNRDRTDDILTLFERFDIFFKCGDGSDTAAEKRQQFTFRAPSKEVDSLLNNFGERD